MSHPGDSVMLDLYNQYVMLQICQLSQKGANAYSHENTKYRFSRYIDKTIWMTSDFPEYIEHKTSGGLHI